MDSKMRKRGWSISSHVETTNSPSHHTSKNGRPRSNTDHSEWSEETLTPAEKEELLSSYPTDEIDLENTPYPNSSNAEKKDGEITLSKVDKGHSDMEQSNEDVLEMFGSQSHDDDSVKDDIENTRFDFSKPTFKCGNVMKIEQKEGAKSKNQDLLQTAKNRLSKWAARLFDPNRPRGLIEIPKEIPQNDEYLMQFGKREKTLDTKTDRVSEIFDENLDEAFDLNLENGEIQINSNNKMKSKIGGMKVYISNLAYTTTELAITRLCDTFGPVFDVNLLMDEKSSTRSKGRAYVTFKSTDDAERFISQRNEKLFEGRALRVAPAINRDTHASGRGRGNAILGKVRYWERDITTKCFRCGEIGHMISSCPNAELPKPCPLCTKPGHDLYSCPLSKICFNCGVPGHINRDCSQRKGVPKRIVCGACFISGHHRWECREREYNIPSYNATCLICHRPSHFTCEGMRWFFGLRGMFCFNCGQSGHHGSICDRPNVDELSRNMDLLGREIERAEAVSVAKEFEAQRKARTGRDDFRDTSSKRGKSLPPRRFKPEKQTSQYGQIQMSVHSIGHHREREVKDKSNNSQRVSKKEEFIATKKYNNERKRRRSDEPDDISNFRG